VRGASGVEFIAAPRWLVARRHRADGSGPWAWPVAWPCTGCARPVGAGPWRPDACRKNPLASSRRGRRWQAYAAGALRVGSTAAVWRTAGPRGSPAGIRRWRTAPAGCMVREHWTEAETRSPFTPRSSNSAVAPGSVLIDGKVLREARAGIADAVLGGRRPARIDLAGIAPRFPGFSMPAFRQRETPSRSTGTEFLTGYSRPRAGTRVKQLIAREQTLSRWRLTRIASKRLSTRISRNRARGRIGCTS
jgi:hypothetical protein